MKLSKAAIQTLKLMAVGNKRLSQFREGEYGEEDGSYIMDGKIVNRWLGDSLLRKGLIRVKSFGNMYHYELTPAGSNALLEAEGAGAE